MAEEYTKIHGYDDKLKPCPFCGSPAELWQFTLNDINFQKVVMCSNTSDENAEPPEEGCPMYMSTSEFHKATKKEAIEAWNKRPDEYMKERE
jgi:Lar family restriction alleviation protein